LRSLEKFFPTHGHVYIVTDGQTPAWLQASHRLTVIDHRDLLSSATRGVFDSGHIESYLHHIPGLSEHFIYLNDDVFFGAVFRFSVSTTPATRHQMTICGCCASAGP